MERLEDRYVLTTLLWDPQGAASNAWDDPRNWNAGVSEVNDRWQVPSEGDDVVFPASASGTYVVRVNEMVSLDDIVVRHSLELHGERVEANYLEAASATSSPPGRRQAVVRVLRSLDSHHQPPHGILKLRNNKGFIGP